MTTSPHAHRGLLLILLAALLWGTVGVATQMIYTLTATNALSIGFLRLAIATPVLLGACWRIRRRHPLRIRSRDLPPMLMIGATMAIYQVCFLGAIPRIGVATTVLIALCTAPVLVAVIAAVLLRERLTRWVGLALVGSVVGTIMLSWADPQTAGAPRDTLMGSLLALSAAGSYALMNVCSRALAGCYHPLHPMTIGLGSGAVFLLPFAIGSGITLSYSPAGWMMLVYLGIVPTALAFVLFLHGMESTTATVASIITLLEALTGTVLAWLLFDEQLGALGGLGAIVLLGSMGLLYREAVQRSRRLRPAPLPEE